MPGQIISVAFSPPIAFIQRQYAHARARLSDLTTLWELLSPIMAGIESELFSTHDWGAWVAGPHGVPAMVETGALIGSLTGGPMSISRESMVWGTDVPYAGYHQYGGWVPGRPPQRTILELRAEERQGKIEPAIVGWVNELFGSLF